MGRDLLAPGWSWETGDRARASRHQIFSTRRNQKIQTNHQAEIPSKIRGRLFGAIDPSSSLAKKFRRASSQKNNFKGQDGHRQSKIYQS